MPSHHPSPYRFLPKSSAASSSQKHGGLPSPSHFSTPSQVISSISATKARDLPNPWFAATPSARPSRPVHDGIEDSGSSSPPQPSQPMYTTAVVTGRDRLEDDERLSPTLRPEDALGDDFDDLIEHYARQQKSRASAVGSSAAGYPLDAPSTPYPRKRRRLGAAESDDVISVSSSLSAANSPVSSQVSDRSADHSTLQVHDTNTRAMAFDCDDVEFIQSRPPSTDRVRFSHFQPVDVATPYTPSTSITKPSFIRPPVPSRPQDPSILGGSPNLLPDAFSPSKKRGRGREYASGGMAQTMVGWILAMGQEGQQTRLVNQSEQQGKSLAKQEYDRIIHITELQHDENDRATVLRDADGLLYLLAEAPSNMPSARRSWQVSTGTRVGIRKGPLCWRLEIEGMGKPSESGHSDMMVSALWDVDP